MFDSLAEGFMDVATPTQNRPALSDVTNTQNTGALLTKFSRVLKKK